MALAKRLAPRLPFYYGWVIVGLAFVTMAVSVSARTAFSLLLPPLIGEFGWDRGLTAGAFSFGFLVFALLSPLVGRAMDRYGPRLVIGTGVVIMTAGLLAAPGISQPWHLYATLGVLVGTGANLMSFTVQSLYLPNWFRRRRGLAIGIAFAGVGGGAVVLLPWLQSIIIHDGWRHACTVMGLLVLCVIGPATLFVARRPEEVGLRPDGAPAPGRTAALDTAPPIDPAQVETARAARAAADAGIVDPAWAAIDWTLHRAIRTARFWWLALGYGCALFAWYAVQVHQTTYLADLGFNPALAAWALGLVSVVAIPGQIGFGALSDRIGREWVWTAGCLGFALCYAALVAMEAHPSMLLLWSMVIAQGFLGYALPSVMGPIAAEIFEGRHFGGIFGTLNVALIGGGAAGPWVAGTIRDVTGSYRPAFLLAFVLCGVSAAAIWLAAPRKVRLVPGRRAQAGG
ncbi:MAG: MFS transporter [Rhodospirillales bacterium]|nr:MFS transporter [Rhodospirillales bacterium]